MYVCMHNVCVWVLQSLGCRSSLGTPNTGLEKKDMSMRPFAQRLIDTDVTSLHPSQETRASLSSKPMIESRHIAIPQPEWIVQNM